MPRLRLFALLIFSLTVASAARALDWIGNEIVGDVLYFYVATPAQIQRYDSATKSWLTPIILPSSRGTLTAATVDADGIYAAYDRAVYRYSSTGESEVHLINAPGPVQTLHTDGNLLFVNHSVSLYAKWISINKGNNAVIASFENYVYSTYGSVIARGLNRFFGTSRGVSPADITYVTYRDDGTFVGGGDGPYHGDYAIGSRVWLFPNGSRLVDTTGNVYSATDLKHTLNFGTTIDDLAFSGVDVPVVLKGITLTAYNNALLPVGSATLTAAAKAIIVAGDEVIAFRANAGTDISTESILLSSLRAPTPGQPVDPRGLAYVPDDIFVDASGLVYLLSKAHQTIFRWDSVNQHYLDGIPLLGSPAYAAHSVANHCIYTAYSSGAIHRLNLDTASPVETPFAQLSSAALGLAVIGNYVFAVDDAGAWVTHYIYSNEGALVASKDWNYYSRAYQWNETNQKLYFFRDDTSPNDLLWEEINANGVAYPTLPAGGIGNSKDSPLHDSNGFLHPIRPAPDGSVVVLGSGMIHGATGLERLATSLANGFLDAAWIGSTLYSARSVSDMTQFQTWVAPSYALGTVRQLPGTPQRIIPLSGDKLLALLVDSSGMPSFYVLNTQFGIVAPASLDKPTGLVGTIQSTSQLQLTWHDIAGEESYTIERRTLPSDTWQTLATTTVGITAYVDSGLQAGESYAYRITATNGPQLQSPTSDPLIFLFAAPSQPTLSGALDGPTAARLNWSASERATSYRLSRQVDGGSWSILLTTNTSTLTYLDASLNSGSTYAYRLEALNNLGTSTPSPVVNITPPLTAPSTPYLYSPSAYEPNSVSLSWSSASRAANYRIERSLATIVSWVAIASVPGSQTYYNDQSVSPETAYQYRVTALNAAGESLPSDQRAVTTPILPSPTSPANFAARALGETSIELTWTDAQYEESYRIERRIGEQTWGLVGTAPANSNSYVDTTATAGTYYNYRVVAVNTRGTSATGEINLRGAAIGLVFNEDFDPAIDATFWTRLSGASVQTAPQGFNAGNALWLGGDGLRQAELIAMDVALGGTLKFKLRAGNAEADGADFWENSETGETVVLEFSTNGSSWQVLANLDTIYPSHSTWISHTINLPAGARSPATRFRWTQRQHSGAGYDTWALDDIQILGVLPDLPAAPAFINGMANSSRAVALSWATAARATSYTIERRTAETGWVIVGQAGYAQTYFTDTTADPATLYSYRVIAHNATGNSEPSSYTIASTWSTLAEWRFQNYGTITDTGIAASLADNGTGIPNLLRYAFNMSATDRYYQADPAGDATGLPNVQFESQTGVLEVAFIRRRAIRHPGINYTVEFSDDLTHWAAAGHEILAISIDVDFEFVVWADTPSNSTPRPVRFARVRVSD